MIKKICVFVFVMISISAWAQKAVTIHDALEKFGFTEQKVIANHDTITYYLKNYTTKPKNLVVHIQGTDPHPVFFYSYNTDGSVKLMKYPVDDYQSLDSTYAYAIVAKPGLSGIFNRDTFVVPSDYHKNNYRQYRVNQIDVAIEDIKRNHLSQTEKIILYGHSEGAQIGAALARVNKSITHFGFWSGNVLNNFYEFALFERIEALKGNKTDAAAHKNIMELLDWYQNIIEDPSSTALDNWGYTNKRWFSYEKAPIDDLLGLDIPIYAVFGTEDESTPIETAYLLPIKFMENRKKNLTFKVFMNYDHSYREHPNGETIDHWGEIFEDFISWTKQE